MGRWLGRLGARRRVLVLAAAVLVAAVVAGGLLVRHGAQRQQRAAGTVYRIALEVDPGRPSLPRPTEADVVQDLTAGRFRPLTGGVHLVLDTTNLPRPGPKLAVYWYVPAYGPRDGVVMAPGSLPLGLPSTPFAARQPVDAFAGAAAVAAAGAAPASGLPTLRLSDARLVYVAVVHPAAVHPTQGFLEPAYLFSGELPSRSAVRILVPALDPSILQH